MILADVAISVGGLIIGLILLVLLVVLGQWGARETGHRWLVPLAVIVGLVVFVLLGFDFSDETVNT